MMDKTRPKRETERKNRAVQRDRTDRMKETDRKSKRGRNRPGKNRTSRQNRLRRKVLIGLSVAIGVLFAAGIFLIAAWLILDYQGRQQLAAKQEAVPEAMGQVFAADTNGEETLQTGELRYQGKTYAYKNDVMTFLFMGIDKTGEMEASEDLYEGGQADALFLAVLDPGEAKISVIGINRDTMTEISIYDRNGLYAGKQTAQIALAHAYGDGMEGSCENTVEAVSQLFYGLPIHGYCALNMEVVNLLNDAVGGVDVIIPESAAGADMEIDGERYKTGWETGQQVHLMGNDAYTFIRYRDTEQAQSAEARLERQKTYLQAFIGQAMRAVKQDLTLPLTLYQAVTPYMVTDITAQEAVHIAGEAVSYSFSEEDLHSMQGEVKMGEVFEEFYADETALYELILQVFYEEVPEGAD